MKIIVCTDTAMKDGMAEFEADVESLEVGGRISIPENAEVLEGSPSTAQAFYCGTEKEIRRISPINDFTVLLFVESLSS